MIDQLRKRFQIGEAVAFEAGRAGFPKGILRHNSGASAEIYPHGAHIASWKNAEGDELFYLSDTSLFEPTKPIRGGIPVIFPQFGNMGPLPAHGFARNQPWELIDTAHRPSGEVEAAFRLTDSPGSMILWPHRFEIELRAILAEKSLAVQIRIANPAKTPFGFQIALHTYFGVGEIAQTAVEGLQGIRYQDSLQDGLEVLEAPPAIRFDREVDRIYPATPDLLRVQDEARKRTIILDKVNMPDVVVWNPWIDKSRRLADFGDQDYLRMVCVETGVIATPLELAPGGEYRGQTVFREG